MDQKHVSDIFKFFFYFLILQNKKKISFFLNSCYGIEIKYLPPSNVTNKNGTCMPANVYVTFREIYMPKNTTEELRFVNPFVDNIPSGSGLFMSTETFSR